jgi:hypothetical protein
MRTEAPLIADYASINPSSLFQRVWRPAILILGSAATVAWIALLGYGIVALMLKAL